MKSSDRDKRFALAQSRDGFLVYGPVAIVSLIIFLVSPNFRWEGDLDRAPYAGDFLQEWVGGYVVRNGEGVRLYEAEYTKRLQHDPEIVGFSWNRGSYLPMVYPPFYYLVVSPFSYLPVRWAALGWGGMMTVLLLVSVRLLAGVGGEKLGSRWFPLLCAVYYPVIVNLASSQKATVCLLIFTTTYVLLRSERRFLAGLVFGIVAFKPQLAIVVPLFMAIRGEWRFVGGCVLTGVFLLALSLMVGGESCLDYLKFSRDFAQYISTPGYHLANAHTLYSFFSLLFGGTPGVTVYVVTGLSIIALLVWCRPLFFSSGGSISPLYYSAMVILTVLLSPHLYTYDLTILLLPLCLITSHLLSREDYSWKRYRLGGWLLLLCYFAPFIAVPFALATGIQLTVLVLISLLLYLRICY